MTNQDTDIKFVDSWSKEDIVELYKSANWWKESYDPSAIKQLITGSFAFAVAVDPSSGKAVGMGRIISDGISDAYIQDLVVLSEHRRKGIGKQLVKALLDRCLSKGMLIQRDNMDRTHFRTWTGWFLFIHRFQNYE